MSKGCTLLDFKNSKTDSKRQYREKEQMEQKYMEKVKYIEKEIQA